MSINYRLLTAIILAVFLVALGYPVTLWLFLDTGLQLHWGLGRAYALWLGVATLLGSLGLGVWLLWPVNSGPSNQRRRR